MTKEGNTHSSIPSGEAGEHYVLYCLLRCGIVAGQAPRGMEDFDLLVERPDGTALRVQVKARTTPGGDGGWPMNKKHEAIRDERLFYAFVDLAQEPPVTYIVPSGVVADCVREILRGANPKWIRLCPDFGKLDLPKYRAGWLDQYKERWESLGVPRQTANAR